MILATTTGDFSRFCPNDEARVDELHRAGFRYIDLSQYSLRRNADLLTSPDWKENAAKLKAHAEKLGMRFVQSHAPGGELMDPDPEKKEALIQATIRSIYVAKELEIPIIVYHAGTRKFISKDEFLTENIKICRRFLPALEETGVTLLTENTTHANMGIRPYFYSGKEMVEFLDEMNHPLFGACWDTGHANIEGPQSKELETLGKYLKGVHINDNRGLKDEHIIPYTGTVNMDDVMEGLIKAGFNGPFTFECDSMLRPAVYWLGNRRAFGGESKLAEPTLAMQRIAEKLLYEVGKHILTTYHMFEG